MSWQNYHDHIMTAIDKSDISSVGTALGSVLSGVTSASGTDRLGLVTAAFAALNGATTIMSVVSGKYGDYEKEGYVARLIYMYDAYAAIGVALMTFLLVGGMEWLEAVAYGLLPVLLFALDNWRKANMHTHPEKKKYFIVWFAFTPFVVLYVSLFVGRKDIAAHILRITATLGIFKSLHGIFAPEHRITSHKYVWDEQSHVWIYLHELDSKQKEAIIAAQIDVGHTRLISNSLVVPLAFGVGSMKAIGISATVHAACLLHDLLSPKIKFKVYALPREIYLAIALFVGWNLFLVDLF